MILYPFFLYNPLMHLNVENFWKDVISQNRVALPRYFTDDAVIRWHCTNEQFTVAEYVQANCEYPNEWNGEIERIETSGDSIVLVGRVFPLDKSTSYHVVSFIKCDGNKIHRNVSLFLLNYRAPEEPLLCFYEKYLLHPGHYQPITYFNKFSI